MLLDKEGQKLTNGGKMIINNNTNNCNKLVINFFSLKPLL
ncbi:hypothetical protein GM3709_3167 [Geminocystis sp. NIES-3709]|nr:hypothetical protein GM3709_3167 [Geminocystis sp. NIES-3709]